MEKIKIKNEHLFKNKTQMVIYGIIFILLIGAFIYLGTKDFSNDIPDNKRFAEEFSMVDKDNVFEYVNATDVRGIVSDKSGIILFGTKNEWVNYYAYMVNEVAKNTGVKKVYYYNFVKNRQDNNGTYEDIVEKLSNYVTYNDRGSKDIYAPALLVVKNGVVEYFDDETAFVKGKVTPSVYWNYNEQSRKEQELKGVFEKYLES